jgi:hypothetical protein
MIRAIWVATVFLAVLSALAVDKVVMTRAPSSVTERPMGQMTVGTDLAEGTLRKADRLEIASVRQEVPAVSAIRPIEPLVPAVSPTPPPIANKIISRHWHDPNAFSTATKPKQTKQTARKNRIVDRKAVQAADHPNLQNR